MLTALFNAIRETHGVPFSELDVSYNKLTDDCISALSELVEDYPGLRRVVLRSNDIGEQGCAQLAELLAHPGCRVEELDISGNKVGGKGVLSLAAMLEVRGADGRGAGSSLIAARRFPAGACRKTPPCGSCASTTPTTTPRRRWR